MNLLEKLTAATVKVYHTNAMFNAEVVNVKKASASVRLFTHMHDPGFEIWDDAMIEIDGLVPVHITRIVSRRKHTGHEYTLKLELP